MGKISNRKLAAELGRSRESVYARVQALQRAQAVQYRLRITGVSKSLRECLASASQRFSDGYPAACSVNPGERTAPVGISDSQVERFLRKHICEYDLARVDEVWFKALIFRRPWA